MYNNNTHILLNNNDDNQQKEKSWKIKKNLVKHNNRQNRLLFLVSHEICQYVEGKTEARIEW